MRAGRAGRAALVALAALAAAPGAHGESARVVGPERVVFDWSRDACSTEHYPDLPVRAFRDAAGRIQLILPHLESTRMVGRRLGRLRVDCRPVLRSEHDPRPSRFDDRQWLAAVYTLDGRTVRGLVHEEYLGSLHAGRCAGGGLFRCWQNAVTSVVSRDGGATYGNAPPPRHLVAAGPYRYRAGSGPAGVFSPSNIVRNPGDGRFYAMVHVERRGAQRWGACIMRTRRLGDPSSWRAWDGSAFSVRFADPYRRGAPPGTGVCAPISRDAIQKMHESLTYNTHIGRWVLVGAAHHFVGGDPSRVASGIWYSASDDLVHWDRRRLLVRAELPRTHRCGDRRPVLYPSLIDPRSPGRNFETTGRSAYLYFTRFNYRACTMGPDRDLVRVRVAFSRAT